MDKRQEYTSQAANEMEMNISSRKFPDSSSTRESNMCLNFYGNVCDADQTEYEHTEDSNKHGGDVFSTNLKETSDERDTPDLDVIIGSFKDMLAARRMEKNSRLEYETNIRGIRNHLVAHVPEKEHTENISTAKITLVSEELHITPKAESGQQILMLGGADQNNLETHPTDEHIDDLSEPVVEFPGSDLDETSGSDTSQEFEACIEACKNLGSSFNGKKHIKEKESPDSYKKLKALQQEKAVLEKSCETFRKCIKKLREANNKFTVELANKQKLRDLLSNSTRNDLETQEKPGLEKVLESIDKVLKKK